jgi:hypothetical protein
MAFIHGATLRRILARAAHRGSHSFDQERLGQRPLSKACTPSHSVRGANGPARSHHPSGARAPEGTPKASRHERWRAVPGATRSSAISSRRGRGSRAGRGSASRLPKSAKLGLESGGPIVYDVFVGKNFSWCCGKNLAVPCPPALVIQK